MTSFYCVLYTNKAPGKKRKNKSFADGLLAVDNAIYTFYDEAGHNVARESLKGCTDLSEGAEVQLESWDLEIDQELSEDDFRQRRQAMKGAADKPAPSAREGGKKQLASPDKGSEIHTSRLEDAFFAVIYTARAPGKKRKNKSFKDGVLRLCSSKTLLYDEEGKVLAERAGRMSGTLQQESEVAIGQWDTEIVEELAGEVFRAGACFQKSDETLLLERLHASRSASANTRQTGAAPPATSTMDGKESSATAARWTDAIEEQSPAAAHVASAGIGCPGSQDRLMPMSSPPQQQQGSQMRKEPVQISCAESDCTVDPISGFGEGSAQLNVGTDSMQSREGELCERAECGVGAGGLHRQSGAPESVSFMDDMDCLDLE